MLTGTIAFVNSARTDGPTLMKKANPKEILSIRCPTCGAAPGEKCELGTGQPRTFPHRDRRLKAAD